MKLKTKNGITLWPEIASILGMHDGKWDKKRSLGHKIIEQCTPYEGRNMDAINSILAITRSTSQTTVLLY